MSGPVSTSEIEDFVSSVRRLVSVDARNRPISRDLAHDRLVLTPSQRVGVAEANDINPLELTARAKDEDASTPASPESVDAEVEGPVADASRALEGEWEEELWTEPDQPLAELALGAEEAEVVVEVEPEQAAPEPEVADPPANESPWAEVGEDWLDEDLELLKPGQMPPEAEKIADRAPAEMQAPRMDVLKLSAEQMLTDGEGNPLTVMDEEALQQIIRQLIRDELKGVLGERITQNVRKLVRAEINRALAAHALD